MICESMECVGDEGRLEPGCAGEAQLSPPYLALHCLVFLWRRELAPLVYWGLNPKNKCSLLFICRDTAPGGPTRYHLLQEDTAGISS